MLVPLKWRSITKTTGIRGLVICEVHGVIAPEGAIFAAVSMKDQKRGQPPFRFRCTRCGPTQEDKTSTGYERSAS